MRAFPDHPFLRGNYGPVLMEADAPDLVIEGEVPKDLAGTLYRNGPNPRFPPRGKGHHWFLGDGMVHAFHIEDGKVGYRNRWVRTGKFIAETEAGEPLFGSSFGPMGHDPGNGHVQRHRDVDPRLAVAQDGIDELAGQVPVGSAVASRSHPGRQRWAGGVHLGAVVFCP